MKKPAGAESSSRFESMWIAVIAWLLWGCADEVSTQARTPSVVPELKDVEILRSWVGDFPAGELDRIPQAQRMGGTGYIDDESELHRVWEVFQSDEPVPNVDFPGDLVLFVHNVQFYNRVSIGQVRLENGVAEVLAMETMSAMPIEKSVVMAMVVVSSENIESLQTPGGILSVPR